MSKTVFEHMDRDDIAMLVFTDDSLSEPYVCMVWDTESGVGHSVYLDVEARKRLILALQESLPQTDQMSGSEEYLQAATEEETAECEKQPLGLVSKQSHDRNRMLDILAAMRRYCDAGKYVPEEWVDELATLLRTQGEGDGQD